MRRVPEWGSATRRVDSGFGGSVRDTGAADHVLWIGRPQPACSGRWFAFVLHVSNLAVRELTQVCFENPGMLSTETGECTTRSASPWQRRRPPQAEVILDGEGAFGADDRPGTAKAKGAQRPRRS